MWLSQAVRGGRWRGPGTDPPYPGGLDGVPPQSAWYKGKVSRQTIEKALREQGGRGDFIVRKLLLFSSRGGGLHRGCHRLTALPLLPTPQVRESERTPGDYSITMHAGHVIKHFKIEWIAAKNCYTIGSRDFPDLKSIIRHYYSNPIYTFPNGETVKLETAFHM